MTLHKKRKLEPDFRIARLSLLGLLGFILGCVLLFYPDLASLKGTQSIFHEISYVPKTIIAQRVSVVMDSLGKVQLERQVQEKWMADSLNKRDLDPVQKMMFTKAAAELERQITTDDANLRALRSLQNSYSYTSEHDTTSFKILNKALHFSIGPHELNSFDQALSRNKEAKLMVAYTLKDPALSFSIRGTTELSSLPASSDISFITKYPGVGIWILLIMIFCSFLLIAISTSFYLRNRIIQFFENYDVQKISTKNYNVLVLVTFICLFAIWFIGRFTFNDEVVIRGIYFMYHIKDSMLLIQVLGFAAGACCLAGFIYTASLLAYFARSVKTSRNSIKETRAALLELSATQDESKTEAQMKSQTEKEVELAESTEQEKKDKEIYEGLKGFFSTYFIISAIILSLLVLCTGGLYSIINNLDFVNLLSDDWGYSPVRNDFIYLYGGLYTVMLLLVYIPAKMRFSEISFAGEEGNNGEAGKETKWYQFLKNPFSQIKELLVAASPLLASLVQSLFQALFG